MLHVIEGGKINGYEPLKNRDEVFKQFTHEYYCDAAEMKNFIEDVLEDEFTSYSLLLDQGLSHEQIYDWLEPYVAYQYPPRYNLRIVS